MPETKRSSTGLRRIANAFGPGLVTGAADDDPSGIATYSQAGAQFGFNLLWTVFLTTPFMIAIQLVSADIGRVTGKGIAANLKEHQRPSVVFMLVSLLLAANIFNIAADIAAMGEALYLVIGGFKHVHALIFAGSSVLLQIFVPYRRYARYLKWLTLVLFCYVGIIFTVDIPWHKVATSTFSPSLQMNSNYLLMIVAVIGTTISPYLFFWQASQEVEEMARGRAREPLRNLRHGGNPELKKIVLDTSIGMIFSNAIAFFIVLTTAVTLNANGITNIQTAADAANALRPIAGDFAFSLFALGIIGTGLLAIPVLAGSAAYAVAEVFGWRSTLEARLPEARGFYVIILASIVVGFAVGFSTLDPIKMLVWSAVLNGMISVPIMAMMMMLITSTSVMGRFRAHRWLAWVGWTATALMGLVVTAMLIAALIGE
jgi:NRAMP (natural resistance-associated macrophage protein)-like metal ion transporter